MTNNILVNNTEDEEHLVIYSRQKVQSSRKNVSHINL